MFAFSFNEENDSSTLLKRKIRKNIDQLLVLLKSTDFIDEYNRASLTEYIIRIQHSLERIELFSEHKEMIKNTLESLTIVIEELENSNKKEIFSENNKLINQLEEILDILCNCIEVNCNTKNSGYNSDVYFNQRIEDLISSKRELEKQLQRQEVELKRSKEYLERKVSQLQKYENKLESQLEQLEVDKEKLHNQNHNQKQEIEIKNQEIDSTKNKLYAAQRRLTELENQLLEKEQLAESSEQQKAELNKKEQEIALTKKQLVDTTNRLCIIEKELEDKKRLDDAKLNWEHKITQTFNTLSSYLNPIKDEHSRLKKLYYGYLGLSAILVLFLFCWEVMLFFSLKNETELPDFFNYLPFYIPIPITGVLLWVFIVQMNRAQRQMVMLAENIHNVEYIEGLLLSLNTLSPSIENAVKRINEAIDRLLTNHLSIKDATINEESILKEEKKDLVPLDTVLKLLKGFRKE